MLKKLIIVTALVISQCAFSHPETTAGTIHTVKLTKGWCGNLSMSTEVGKWVDGTCHYEKKTTPYNYDGCVQHLNGGFLEDKVGKGYDCAITHIHAIDGKKACDAFRLITDENGHYIGSDPAYREMVLQ